MHCALLILICKIVTVHSLTCDDILELPANKILNLQELQTVEPKDVIQCLAHLGKEQLGVNEAEYIWKTLVKYYDGILNIPEKVLALLHWVTPAISPEEYANITLSSIDVIQNFGLNYNLNQVQLSAIADRVREDYAGKEPEDYTYYDLAALRQILCAFNRSEIERIRPSAYREAALIIGKLQQCNPEVLAGFALLAVQNRAFGLPHTWSSAVEDVVGVVAEYVTKNSKQVNYDPTITPTT